MNVFIDITPEVSAERITAGRNSIELYENIENLRHVREKYLESFERLKLKENIFITDGDRREEEIAKDIWDEVSKLKVATRA